MNPTNYKLSKIKGRTLEINFEGGDVTSDAGGVLLREADKKLGFTKLLAECFSDDRDKEKITHKVETMLKQRIYGIALGYEDLNDQDSLRSNAAIQTIVGTDKEMASSATLCRFENKASREFAVRSHELMVETYIKSQKKAPKEIILDFDATDDEIHGNQEGKFYHGYYNHNCFLPLYVFAGKDLLVSYLRSSKEDQAKHSWAILSLLVKKLRFAWPDIKIIFRGDSGFCRHKIFNWCEKHNVYYIVGIGQNKRLNDLLEPTMVSAQRAFDKTSEKQKHLTEFSYKAGSWKSERKIIGKAEVTKHGKNHRYIVTNLEGNPEDLYNKSYCLRGDMENRIKEQQLHLFADRTSCNKWWPNQLRLILSGAAYILLEYIRSKFLRGTQFAVAQVNTIRLKLLKIGAVIIRNSRSIKFLFSSSYPYQKLWDTLLSRFSVG